MAAAVYFPVGKQKKKSTPFFFSFFNQEGTKAALSPAPAPAPAPAPTDAATDDAEAASSAPVPPAVLEEDGQNPLQEEDQGGAAVGAGASAQPV